MAITIRFDYDHSVEQPTLILATRSGRLLHQLPIYEASFKDTFNDGSEFQFSVNKNDCVTADGKIDLKFWRDIKDLKLAYCKEYDKWYELRVETNENDMTIKTVSAKSLGKAELSQITVYSLEANTESDIARDDYSPTVIYDADHPERSLINRLLNKAPHYSVGHVDESIAGLQRTFSFDKRVIDDCFADVAEEIGCLVEYDCKMSVDGHGISREVNVYDLESVCRSCGKRGNFFAACDSCGSTDIKLGYGEDTNVFVDSENLADLITYSTDTDQVKNCFRLAAGDDLMTATVANCNPNGSEYIWYISDEVREDMSEDLASRLDEYDALYDYYQDEYVFEPDSDTLTAYNEIISKYSSSNPDLKPIDGGITGYAALMQAYYDTIDLDVYLSNKMMPSVAIEDTTAAKEAATLENGIATVAVSDISKCSTTTVASAVLSMAKTYIDKRYDVKIASGEYAGQQWTGSLSVSNKYDEDDAAVANITATVTDDFESQTKQKIDAVLRNAAKDNYGVDALFSLDDDAFKAKIAEYGLSGLRSLLEICTSVVNVLIGQGVSDANEAISASGLYTDLYLPYYNKLGFLQDEIAVREGEILAVSGGGGLQAQIEKARQDIHDALDFQSFIGDDLWKELASYRREDVYENNNYISDGLTTEELFANAAEFLEIAQKEIYKSATQQHVISSNLKNLLVMEEFHPIVKSFAVGNWIRVKIDGDVYRLRLLDYQFDYHNPENMQVTFSDVRKGIGTVDDLVSIFKQANSMATVFNAVAHQAGNGNKGAAYIFDWLERGLDLTSTKIVNAADNQDIVYDRNGLVAREYSPFLDDYDDKQVKVINRGVYVTDDGWKTATTGIGEFVYWNPITKAWETDFGVIAKKLVASLMLSEEVMVYNQNNTINLGDGGIVVTTEAESNDENGIAFTIQRHIVDEDGEHYEPIFSVNNDGRLVLDGSFNVRTSSGESSAFNTWLDSFGDLESKYKDEIPSIRESITQLKTENDNFSIQIAELRDSDIDVDHVITSTGYRFDSDGLAIRKSGGEIQNLIDNTGMYVNRYSGDTAEKILVANNEGVEAINIKAKQFLIIGEHARFESFSDGTDTKRTACFYIGG